MTSICSCLSLDHFEQQINPGALQYTLSLVSYDCAVGIGSVSQDTETEKSITPIRRTGFVVAVTPVLRTHAQSI